ncbi:hypothetical protein QTP88_016057 [Uroleucon formosanum]
MSFMWSDDRREMTGRERLAELAGGHVTATTISDERNDRKLKSNGRRTRYRLARGKGDSPAGTVMFNPPKLHNHDWFMTMVTTLIESSVKGGSGGGGDDGDGGDDHGWSGLYGPNGTFDGGGGGPFNFTVNRALNVIFDDKQIVDKVLVLYMEVAIVITYGMFFVVGLVSNGLVCFVVFRQCGKKNVPSQGPSPRNLYIVNLAFADIIMCVVCMPFTLWALMSRRWTWGLIMCKTVPAAQGANITVSACTITAIALDRYIVAVDCPIILLLRYCNPPNFAAF